MQQNPRCSELGTLNPKTHFRYSSLHRALTKRQVANFRTARKAFLRVFELLLLPGRKQACL